MMKQKICDFLTAFSGCKGGEIGSAEQPSIWGCGIEWGQGFETSEVLRDYIESREQWAASPSLDQEEFLEMLKYPYDRSTLKLLTAMSGGKVDEYKSYLEKHKQNNGTGLFMLNLYPIDFKNTRPEHWKKEYEEILGFKDKGGVHSLVSPILFY